MSVERKLQGGTDSLFWQMSCSHHLVKILLVHIKMKGSPCCAGLMRSCLHTYRTKTNLTQHIIQPWGGASAKYGGAISQVWGGHQPSMGGAISQVWGGHQPTMGGPSVKYGGGHQPTMGGPSAKYGGGHQPTMGGAISPSMGGSSTNYGGGHQPSMGGGIFPPVCTGSQNPQNTLATHTSCRL